jgi:hypothetical protein
MLRGGNWGRAVTAVGTTTATLATLHTLINLTALRTPLSQPPVIDEPITVLLPVRNEAHRVGACLRSLRAQRHITQLEILVLDDGSTDGTADVVLQDSAGDPRCRLIRGTEPPSGSLGKPHACAQLADAASGSVLVFVDADVVFEPDAIACAVNLLRQTSLDLISPYPRQLATGVGQRLVQPLLQWSWLTMVPLGLAERSDRSALAVANGQFLVVDSAAYHRAGGHEGIRGEVLDDLALLRAVRRSGGRGTVVDGTALASCRMYDDWDSLVSGYTKSLWSAFGSPAGAMAVVGTLGCCYLVPAAAALRGSRTGWVGYIAGVVGRVAVARRTGGRCWPDAAGHPGSIAVFGWLVVKSLRHHKAGRLTWKGRVLS